MARTTANGIEIEYETFGDPGQAPLLLVMGLGAQMILWDERFCGALAEEGFFVIRYDNRDTGLSTKFDQAGLPDLLGLMTAAGEAATSGVSLPAGTAPYSLDDMADDGIGLLDALGVARAHIVGASMGGMIVQAMAIRHPARVLSLCSIMSTTGALSVGQPTPEAMTALMQPPVASREEALRRAVEAQKVIGGKGFPIDEDQVRERAGVAYDRCFYPEGMARQLAAIVTASDRTRALGDVKVPALVIHGQDDPLVTPSGGDATARAIPGSELLVIPGMGHDLPEPVWPQIIGAIVANTRKAATAPAGTSS